MASGDPVLFCLEKTSGEAQIYKTPYECECYPITRKNPLYLSSLS